MHQGVIKAASRPLNRDRHETKIFGRKAVKLSKSQKELLENLLPEIEIPLSDEAIDLDRCFSAGGPLHLEIGFGGGEYTTELARRCPDHRIIGCEIFKNGIASLLASIRERDISNIRIIEGNALSVIEKMFESGTFDFIHINHPDPWPKKRHHKRRIIQPDTVELLAEALKKGGEIWLSTDISEYADWMEECFAASGKLEPLDAERRYLDKVLEDEFATKYEMKGLKQGRTARHLRYRKKQGPTSNGRSPHQDE